MGGYARGSKQTVCKIVTKGFVSSTLTPPTKLNQKLTYPTKLL